VLGKKRGEKAGASPLLRRQRGKKKGEKRSQGRRERGQRGLGKFSSLKGKEGRHLLRERQKRKIRQRSWGRGKGKGSAGLLGGGGKRGEGKAVWFLVIFTLKGRDGRKGKRRGERAFFIVSLTGGEKGGAFFFFTVAVRNGSGKGTTASLTMRP